MVFRRRRFARRRFNRRRRTTRTRRLRRTARGHTRVVSFKRTQTLGTVATNASGYFFASYQFKLADLPNYSDITNLFEVYRLRKVVVRATPLNPNTTQTTLNIANCGSIVDYDDAVAVSSISTMDQYHSFRMHSPMKGWTRTFYPKHAVQLYNEVASVGGTAYAQRSGWINTAWYNVPHYGLKVGIEGASVSTNIWSLAVTYYVDARDYA